MKTIITRIKRLALALCFVTPLVSWAAGGSATNPVTGAAESYQYYFVGGDATNPGDWATQANWKVGSDDSDYTTLNKNYAPAVYINNNSGETYGTVLFDGVNCPDNKTITSTGSKIEGWTFKIGAYNGVDVTIDHLDLWSAGQGNVGSSAASVDATSKITIKEINNGKNWPSTIDYYIAANEGLTYKGAFRPTGGSDLGTIRYWFAGAGSVVYEDVVEKCAHVIKQADVTLTGGAKEVKFKTLVTFASTTKTFSADNALITVKNSGGTAVRGVRLSSVTSGTTTLTTDNNVGDCELVQTATGVLLYYVDGDADAITYTPSISINFRDSDSNTLNTFADVGLTGYAVPGTVWNNYTIPDNANEQTFNTVNQIDSAGDSSAVPGATVTVSGHRGRYYCSSLDASIDPRRGYIDDGNSAETMSPSVTITGIPYDNYRVIVYHATDSNNALFGYDTINGTDFTYVDGQQTIGTTGWGASGAQNTALPIQEGVNTLVSGILSGSTVTMVAHRMSNPTARGCFAAIQVVEVAASDSDLVINVNGNTEYEVTESKQYDNVIIAGTGNLTFTGEGTITADTLNIDPVAAVVKVNSTQLSVSKVIGNGVAIYEGALPPDGAGWWTDASEWKGTVWIKNYTTKLSAFESNKYGNNNSVLRLTGLNGYLQRTTTAAPYTHMTLELVDDGDTPAFTYNDGWGGSAVYISALKGNGTFAANSAGNGEIVYVADPSAFTGSFNLTHKKVQLGGSAPNGDNQNWNGKILIPSGATATVASGKTWYAGNGIEIEGTLTSNGALDVPTGKSIAVSGSLVNTGTIGIYGGVSVAANGTLTNNGRIWAVGGITVNGTLKTDKYTTTDNGRFGSGTAITLGDTGVFELASTGNTDDGSTSYSQITGTGKIKYSGSGYWVLSSNHPTAITLEAEQASALVVPVAGATIGSLTGTKGFRSDWDYNTAAGRYLTIKQFKDTSWSGSINQPSATHRLTGVVVDPGESTTGTLEVTGTQTYSATLTVNGSVNLTGTWVGNTTVSGTFGGTGTLTGNLTFSDGATFKAFASDEDGLSVSGAFTYPAEGKVAVDVSALTLDSETEVVLLTGTTEAPDATKFDVTGTPGYGLKAVGYALTLYAVPTVSITVPNVENATVAVSDGTTTYTPTTEGGTSYSVPEGSTITVTYTAAEGYGLEGTSSYTLPNVAEGDAVTITDTEAKLYVAQFNNVKYTTVQGAINAWAAVTDQMTAYIQVSLLGDVTESSVTIPVGAAGMPCQINGYNHTLTAPVTINAGAFLSPTALTIEGNLTVNGTYYRIGPAAIAVSGALTFGDGATIAVTALSSETSVFDATGAVTISGDLNVLLYSETLTAGEYTIATGASVTRDADSQVVVTLNETVTDTWALSNTETAVVLTGAAARVNGDTYPTFTEAVTAANGTETIELLAAASYTLTEGETVIVKAGSFTFTVSAPQGYVISETTVSDGVVSYTTSSALVRTTKEVYDSGAWRTADGYPKEYASIVAAIADITIAPVENSTRYTVTMLGNETLSTRAEPNYSMTIDLGGYTLTREGTGGNGSVFDVKNGTVTIKNGTIDCTQDDTAIVKDGVYAITARSGSAVTLEDLTITVDSQAGACVYPFNGATVTIKSGTYKNKTAEEYQYHTGWTGMAVNQANVTTRLLFIEGGKFWQVNPEEGDDSGKVTNFLAAGRIAKLVDGYWTVSEGAWAAQVTGGAKFESLAEAVTAAESDATVTLLADAALTATQTIDKNLTIDLNGHNVTATDCRAFHVTAGAFALTGSGTVSATADENVNTSTFPTNSSVIRVGSNTAATSFTLGAGVTVSSDYCYGITYFGTKKQTVVINGTVAVTGEQTAISGNGSKDYNTEAGGSDVTVNGTVSASQNYAIYNPQTGTTAINGTVSGVGGIEAKSGVVTIDATAEITATGTPSYTGPKQNDPSTVGYAIASVSNASYKDQPPTVTVASGATVTGTVIVIKENKSETYGTLNAANNTLTIPEGYEWIAVDNGYTLAEVQEVPVEVEPGAQTEPVDSEAAAQAAAAKVVPSVPAAVAAKLSDDQETAYKALFEPKVVDVKVGDTTKYAVEVALKDTVVTEIQTAVDAEADDLAKAAVAAAADATNGGEATVVTKPGLYYVVEAGTEPDATAPESCTLAESGSTTLPVPNKGAKGFYKIRVSVTPVAVPVQQ